MNECIVGYGWKSDFQNKKKNYLPTILSHQPTLLKKVEERSDWSWNGEYQPSCIGFPYFCMVWLIAVRCWEHSCPAINWSSFVQVSTLCNSTYPLLMLQFSKNFVKTTCQSLTYMWTNTVTGQWDSLSFGIHCHHCITVSIVLNLLYYCRVETFITDYN